ncbi:histone H2A-like [Haemaphysalis longicornis]
MERPRRKSTTARAGLVLSVPRVRRGLRRSLLRRRISPTAAVYLAATLEYLVAEMLYLSGKCAKDNSKRRIRPRDLALAIGMDAELSPLMRGVILPGGGVVPQIQSALLPSKTPQRKELPLAQ